MSNKTYDTIKIIALACVPILSFVSALCTIWNVGHAEQITASLTAINTLLGALVVILAREYNKEIPSEFEREMDAMGAGEEIVDADDEDGEDDE